MRNLNTNTETGTFKADFIPFTQFQDCVLLKVGSKIKLENGVIKRQSASRDGRGV